MLALSGLCPRESGERDAIVRSSLWNMALTAVLRMQGVLDRSAAGRLRAGEAKRIAHHAIDRLWRAFDAWRIRHEPGCAQEERMRRYVIDLIQAVAGVPGFGDRPDDEDVPATFSSRR
ncbi:hypothetical protein GCM10011289_32730 [Paludibacterium paludis]|uniref:Uncharacterized protein n=1 Tax=Paludibacterium paludis TaxID=1225769 RepID=A0A918P5M7_9NEIS|nr:hypothetical protein GCM10011289_32730 [Paludibacterium paludis]